MDILSLVTSVTLAAHLYHGIYILLINRSSKLNRLYFLATVAITFFALMFVMANQQKLQKDVIFYYRIGMFAFIPYFAICVHFTLEVTLKSKIKYFIQSFFYIIAIIFIIRNILSPVGYKEFVWVNKSLLVVINKNNMTEYVLFIAYMLSVGFTSVYLFVKWGKEAKDNKTKMQARYLLIALIIIMIAIINEFLILPFFFDYRKFTMGISWYILFVFATVYISVKYRFLYSYNSNINKEILPNLTDIIILFDKSYNILHANEKAQSLFCFNRLNQTKINDLLLECEEHAEKMSHLLKNPADEFQKKCSLKNGTDSNITVNAKFTAAKDSFGDIMGILLTAREIKEIKYAQDRFQLTERQVEVINHLLTGKPAREIAEQMQITERTVKAHITTIYNRLGINNKYELYNKLNNIIN